MCLLLGVAVSCWQSNAYSYRYASEYLIQLVVPGSTKEYKAGLIKRVGNTANLSRYSGVKLTLYSLHDFYKHAGALDSTSQLEKSLRTRTNLEHFCSKNPVSTSGHPIDILKILCSRPHTGKVDITSNPFSKYRLTRELTLNVIGQLFPIPTGVGGAMRAMSTLLTKSYSYHSVDLPTYEEIQEKYGDTIEISGTYPTKEEVDKRNEGVEKRFQEEYSPDDLAGKDVVTREWVVDDKTEMPSSPRATHQRSLYLPASDVQAIYAKYDNDIPHVLFLTSADEEKIHAPRHLVLPFPYLLIEKELSAGEGCKRPFEMPTISVDAVSPDIISSPVGMKQKIMGTLLNHIEQSDCVPDQVKKLDAIQDPLKEYREKMQESSKIDQAFEKFKLKAGEGRLQAVGVTDDELMCGRKLACAGKVIPEADNEVIGTLDKYKELGEKVSIVYTMDERRTQWQYIIFTFFKEGSSLPVATVTFQAQSATEEEKLERRNSRSQRSSKAGADNYDNWDFLPTAPSSGTGL